MNQPTNIQMLDTAIWQELGGREKADDAETVYQTLSTLLFRWLLARSEYPEMEAIHLLQRSGAYGSTLLFRRGSRFSRSVRNR
jgi:hypothetical protein